MHPRWFSAVPLLFLPAVLTTQLAWANIYTWVDTKGIVNVSNLPPPDGAKLLGNTPDPPTDPARDAALREAARQAEVQALAERVQQLQRDLDQTRRDAAAAAAPAVNPPAPVVVYVAPSPAVSLEVPVQFVQPASGCDYGFNCGFWPGVGYYYPAYTVASAPPRHRGGYRYPPLFGGPGIGMPPTVGGQPPRKPPPGQHTRPR